MTRQAGQQYKRYMEFQKKHDVSMMRFTDFILSLIYSIFEPYVFVPLVIVHTQQHYIIYSSLFQYDIL